MSDTSDTSDTSGTSGTHPVPDLLHLKIAIEEGNLKAIGVCLDGATDEVVEYLLRGKYGGLTRDGQAVQDQYGLFCGTSPALHAALRGRSAVLKKIIATLKSVSNYVGMVEVYT